MNEQMNLKVCREDLAAATAASAKQWLPLVSGNPLKLIGNGSSQCFPPAPRADKLLALTPHLWAESLKLHGIPELNSPLAG